MIVLIKNELLPPMKWEMGRIIETFADAQNLVRSVRVKTANSIFVRPIVKICPLPMDIPTGNNSHVIARHLQESYVQIPDQK